MKALILVGGYGTRIRPLSLTKPKPLIEFCNKPILVHQIEALAAAGVDEVVLAVGYQPKLMADKMGDWEEKLGVKITYSHETEPLGTAGPLALAEKVLSQDEEPFFVLNSDVTCEFPLKELLAFHKNHGKEGTIMATRVEDPSKYGVVVHDHDGRIRQFVEKPQTFVGNYINAGIYIFNNGILSRVPRDQESGSIIPTSIEKVVFPSMAAEGELFVTELKGHWADVGQPKDYLSGMCLFLKWRDSEEDADLRTGQNFVGNVLVDPSAEIGDDCLIGPDVVIGPGCKVGSGARIARSALLANSEVKPHALVKDSIIGWDSSVGPWARVENVSVLGEDVQIAQEIYVNGIVVLPHKGVKENSPEPRIMM